MKATHSWLIGLVGAALLMGACWLITLQLQSSQQQADENRAAQLLQAAQEQLEANASSQLRLRADLLALDGATMAYIVDALQQGSIPGQNVDAASISDVLAERRSQLGLDLVGVIAVDGRWIAGTRPWTDSSGSPARHPLFQQARDSHEAATGLVLDERRLYLASIQPIVRAGNVDAYLFAANEIGAEFVAALARLAPVEISVYASDDPQNSLLQSSPELRGVSAENRTRPLFADAATAQLRWSALESDANSDGSPLILGLGAVLSLLWMALVMLFRQRVLRPIDSACDLLERAAMGDFHLRAPAWPHGLRGRFAAAFDSLMLRLGAP
ncbi:MAG: cache domain-containing protein [Lysobacterales bacterium]